MHHQMLRAGVEGPCLHSQGNWLVRQLNDEQSQYIKQDLLERKERLQLENCSGARKQVTHCSDEGWGFYRRFNTGLGGLVLTDRAFHGLS
jgi:hypothetical protein